MSALEFDAQKIQTVIDRIVKRTLNMDFTWDWPAGVAFYGVSEAFRATGNPQYLEALIQWVDQLIEDELPPYTINAVSIGHTLITLYQETRNDKYLQVAITMADYLKNEAPRFADGIFQHTVSQNYNFPEQAWVDTLFMAGYFLVRMGALLEREDYFQDGLKQYHGHEQFLQDSASNLYYHGWDNIQQNNLSAVFWARGNAWAAYTMARVHSEIPVTHPSFMRIQDSVRDQLSALVRLQSEEGLWHTVLTDPDSYLETSGSAGIAAALVSFNEQMGSPLYNKYIQKSINGILSRVTEDGTVASVSAGTAVMEDNAGYKGVPHKRIQGWGQGLTLVFLSSLLNYRF
ncbi:MAG: glycosyl hydrolase family 88 [Bacilli bacterium]|nr:glycosyl hydrolase family 88 [Bacilli bacterium]